LQEIKGDSFSSEKKIKNNPICNLQSMKSMPSVKSRSDCSSDELLDLVEKNSQISTTDLETSANCVNRGLTNTMDLNLSIVPLNNTKSDELFNQDQPAKELERMTCAKTGKCSDSQQNIDSLPDLTHSSIGAQLSFDPHLSLGEVMTAGDKNMVSISDGQISFVDCGSTNTDMENHHWRTADPRMSASSVSIEDVADDDSIGVVSLSSDRHSASHAALWSSLSEGEWRASPQQMQRLANMATSFRIFD